jgi:hypothetical protein
LFNVKQLLPYFYLFSVTRVRSQGSVWVNFNVMFKDFHQYGFENGNWLVFLVHLNKK